MISNFYLRDKNSKKETAIILFASHPNGRLKYYTGYHVKPIGWDFEKQITKKNAAINGNLATIVTALADAEGKLVRAGTRVTNESLVSALLVELKRDKQHVASKSEGPPITSLSKLIERFVELKKGQRTKGTMLRFKALKLHLSNFEKQNKVVLLKDINTEFGDEFISHLYEQGHKRNTVGKLIIGLKVVLNWAVGSGYQVPTHYKKFPIPSSPTKIIALTEQEFGQFCSKEIPVEEHITRDLFCFSAFTGLRYSDVVRITPEMVKGDWLYITTKKTEVTIKVFLVPEAIELLEKYKFTFHGLRTNQGANRGVKRIAKLAGIDEPVKITDYYGNRKVDRTVRKWEVLSFHSAKKTFVTMSLKNGVRPEVVSSQVGNTMRTLKPYIAIADLDKELEIGKAFKIVKTAGQSLRVA